MWLYNNRDKELTNRDEKPAKTCKKSDSDEEVISGEIGCIYPYCFKPNTDIPRMVLVDTGMSFAFNLNNINNDNKLDETGNDILEILLIEKSDGSTTFDKYNYVRNGVKTPIQNNEGTNTRPSEAPIGTTMVASPGGKSRRVKKQKKNSRKYTKTHSKTKKSRRKIKNKKI
jgi:hypothetical protein